MKIKNLFLPLLVSGLFFQLPIVIAADTHEHEHTEEEVLTQDSAEHDYESEDEAGHEDEHEHEGGSEHEDENESEHEEGAIKLSAEQMQIAGVKVEPLQLQKIQAVVNAPGKVKFNTYKTASITPRIMAQLIERHVVLGETVKKGQPIVTLSSVEMAEAQGLVLVTDREWKRVKKLGLKIVTEKRYTEARVNWELAKAKAIAYGMTKRQIKTLINTEDFSRANGRFVLVAAIDGTVLKEDYIKGQQIEPGQELNLITDESSLWVMANVTPALAKQIQLDNNASVQYDGQVFPAKVSQISHALDEHTRTTNIRLSVENKNDELHSGLFVDTQIEISDETEDMALVLPEAAVIRSADGDWQVLVEQDEEGEFKGVEIELLRVVNGVAVIEGLEPGTPVVIQGAFFVQSELAKSGFEVHNH
jgi:membrane fusion protein, heavy metal efflux system